mmetsp:Transcript_12718/g.31229  ORF Transcript_12718/g.31229 Transcript_12718/m.31229 type:complete len:202 (+) Transcript_12718:55-660(+)
MMAMRTLASGMEYESSLTSRALTSEKRDRCPWWLDASDALAESSSRWILLSNAVLSAFLARLSAASCSPSAPPSSPAGSSSVWQLACTLACSAFFSTCFDPSAGGCSASLFSRAPTISYSCLHCSLRLERSFSASSSAFAFSYFISSSIRSISCVSLSCPVVSARSFSLTVPFWLARTSASVSRSICTLCLVSSDRSWCPA